MILKTVPHFCFSFIMFCFVNKPNCDPYVLCFTLCFVGGLEIFLTHAIETKVDNIFFNLINLLQSLMRISDCTCLDNQSAVRLLRVYDIF